jgi:hypothetical protein
MGWPRNGPGHVSIPQRHSILFANQPRPDGNLPPVGGTNNGQDDQCHVPPQEELLLIVQEHCKGVFKDV